MAYLDDIIAAISGNPEGTKPQDAQEATQKPSDGKNGETTRLHYSDEFWNRFGKTGDSVGNADGENAVK